MGADLAHVRRYNAAKYRGDLRMLKDVDQIAYTHISGAYSQRKLHLVPSDRLDRFLNPDCPLAINWGFSALS